MEELNPPGEDVVALFEQLTALSGDYGAEVAATIAAAADTPLESDRARRLYMRLITLLKHPDPEALSHADRRALVEEVHAEVAAIVESVDRPDAGAIRLVPRNGLEPHEVRPVPIFNNQPIPMREGCVDVERLDLWAENHRLQLPVSEFTDLNGRAPDPDELLKIMQGQLALPGLDDDEFEIEELATSIARRGVDRPPIVSFEGEPKDGNRRIAASLLVLHSSKFSPEQKERARWIRVWRAPKGTTDDQFQAIVVALNFENDYKKPWPEYVKARLVAERTRSLREALQGRVSEADLRAIKKQVSGEFAIKVSEVTRYVKMVNFAEDFEEHHTEHGRAPANVRYKANDIFQWFYEIDAGRKGDKITERLDGDDDLKAVVYDLMFDVLDSGAQVRNLYKVVADSDAAEMLEQAHRVSTTSTDDALKLVKEAIEEAKRKSPSTGRIGFDQSLQKSVERLENAAPAQWQHLETSLLLEVKRAFTAALGAVDGELVMRGVSDGA